MIPPILKTSIFLEKDLNKLKQFYFRDFVKTNIYKTIWRYGKAKHHTFNINGSQKFVDIPTHIFIKTGPKNIEFDRNIEKMKGKLF